jgi:polycomb protein EED
VLWQIEGFSSSDPIPGPLDAPTPTDMAKQTRSYFTPTLSQSRPAMFTRLAQFHTPDCGVQFFMRFRIFRVAGKHPVLAFANAKSKTFFWDLARFGSYARYMDELKEAQKRGRLVGGATAAGAGGEGAAAAAGVQKPAWLMVKRAKKGAAAAAMAAAAVGDGTSSLRSFAAASVAGGDKESMVSASPDPEGGGATGGLGYSRETLQAWAEMYDLSNPVGYVKAHRTLQIDGGVVGRQVGWSPEGDWCVVVGNGNRALIYQRWGKEKGVAMQMA